MANTYTLIASNTLSSSAASVTFSSIPNTYTDLVLKFSVRSTTSGLDVDFTLNGVTATSYSRREILGNGASAFSFSASSTAQIDLDYFASNTTSNTFNNGEFYLPSYTVSQNKPISFYYADERNNATAYITAMAGLFRNTSAITSFTITAPGTNLETGSSFFLYGIKNS